MLRPGGTSRAVRALALGPAVALLVSAAGACGAGPGRPVVGGDAAPATTVAGPLVLPGAPEVAVRGRLAPVLGASVAADGRSLELYAQPVEGGPAGAGELSARAEVTADAVEVVVERGPVAGPATGPPVLCRLERGLHVLRVPLGTDLGGRPVRDGATGASLEPVPVGEIVRPAVLPAGWSLLEERPLREGDRQTGWAQQYGSGAAGPGVSLVQRRASLGPSERFTVGRIDRAEVSLRGATAVWSRQADGNATALVWVEAGWEVAVTSAAGSGTGPLGQAALEAFATSLQRPG